MRTLQYLFMLLLPIKLNTVIPHRMISNVINRHINHKNIAALIVTKTFKHGHITPVSKILQWLTVKFGICFKIKVLTFQTYHGVAPA